MRHPLAPVCLSLVLSGCLRGTRAPRLAEPPPWLTDVRIQGQDAYWDGILPRDPALPGLGVKAPRSPRDARIDARQTAFAARAALSHPLPEWWQAVPIARSVLPVPHADEAVLRADSQALKRWFVDHGWLDARVRLELTEDHSVFGRWLDRRMPGDTRRATYVVDTGQRWAIRNVEIDGLDAFHRPLRRELTAAVQVRPGPYSSGPRHATEAAFREILGARGFADPYVDSVLVPHHEDRTVTLLLHIDAGSRSRFGELQIDGLTAVDRERIHRRLAPRVEPGTRFDATRLRDLEAALDRVPAFARVSVAAGARGPDGQVPVLVSISEAEPGGFTPVVELSSDPTFYAAELGFAYRANVVGGQLATFESRTTAGYRILPVLGTDPFNPDSGGTFYGNHGPAGSQRLTSEVWLRPASGVSFALEAEGDLEPVWATNLTTVSGRGGLRIRPSAHLAVALEPELSWWRSFPWPDQQELYDRWFAEPDDPPRPLMSGLPRPTFRPDAVGALGHLRVSWLRVDKPMLPTKGGVLEADLVPIGTADRDRFTRVSLSARRFIAVGSPRLVVVPRVEAGLMHFFDPAALAVPQLRFRLGGGANLRGFGVYQANPPGYDGGPADLRPGGNVMMMGSLEARYALWPRLHLVAFTDAGRTWESLTPRTDPTTGGTVPGVSWDTLLPTAGVGVALPTPIGDAVASLAGRLRRDTQLTNSPPPVTIHFTLVPSW